MNNLDPEVAERPDDLVVYGGSGRAARSWPAFDAIVQEAVPTDEHLLDLGRFYGAPDDPEARDANIARISGDARRFIDIGTLQTAPMRELIMRSAPWQHPGGG